MAKKNEAKHEPKVAKVALLETNTDQHAEVSDARTTTMLKNTTQLKPVTEPKRFNYKRFDEINGEHPWKEKIPGSYITYPVRVLSHGKVAYFNFTLAKEMGLIGKTHPDEYNDQLDQKLIETFSLQIINEYDQQHGSRFAKLTKDIIKPNQYMATRYLQLQHTDKTGKTSGDGRSIWNGAFENGGKIWDISSRGTGVTALAPGVVEAGKPLKTGSEKYGYGCGLAEIDELYGTAIMSEIFHNQGINTERMLAIIDIGKGLGIGVRAGLNLMRPAHVFNHLKQVDQQSVLKSLEYLIERQFKNGRWNFSTQHAKKYDKLLEQICESYANFSAILDIDYIFAWLDWDGDNALTDAGIIDYGSVRQFGLRYDQYRYDDIDRFSTNLNEQKQKSQLLVQVFVQTVEFARTGKKRALESFKDHHVVRLFQKHFAEARLRRILYHVGFDDNNVRYLLSDHRVAVETFAAEYDYIERKKTSDPVARVSDGINRPVLFNIRNILRELPHYYATSANFETAFMEDQEFYNTLFAENTKDKDRGLSSSLHQHARKFQVLYKDLIRKSKRRRKIPRILSDISARARRINRDVRITGNGIICAVEEILKARRNGLSRQQLHEVMKKFILNHSLDPALENRGKKISLPARSSSKKLYHNLLTVIDECKEDI